MALNQAIREGDRVIATHKNYKTSITAQAGHDLEPYGPASLVLYLSPTDALTINVNFWDVEVPNPQFVVSNKE